MTDAGAWIDPYQNVVTIDTATEELVRAEPHPGSQYEPHHLRTLHVNNQAQYYIARAIKGGEVIAETTGKNRYEAMDRLGDRLRPIFQAMRVPA